MIKMNKTKTAGHQRDTGAHEQEQEEQHDTDSKDTPNGGTFLAHSLARTTRHARHGHTISRLVDQMLQTSDLASFLTLFSQHHAFAGFLAPLPRPSPPCAPCRGPSTVSFFAEVLPPVPCSQSRLPDFGVNIFKTLPPFPSASHPVWELVTSSLSPFLVVVLARACRAS